MTLAGDTQFECIRIPTKDYGFDTDGDMFVLDSSGERWTLDPAVLTENSNPKMLSNAPPCKTSKTFNKGDLVLICNDSDELEILQGDLWRDGMALTRGKIGSITDIISNGLGVTLPMKGSMMHCVYKPEAVTLLNYDPTNRHQEEIKSNYMAS
ncbi:E3 ubiquitin-protein ligase mind-bomb-like [Dreissena polymorpha]|uniref:E3 ubiquitin-protein ligase mind-bomb-like n=1 Tax=Dreissena polymorpha TaxID=45954 RepID=UPI002263AD2D|nr:E3 ubiquitin-protein ligase mind-bomb-like [Dreissena polymorpha]